MTDTRRRMGARPRVAFVHPYWAFWEGSVDFDLRADRDALAALAREQLDVEWVGHEHAECVLVLQTMATPPAATLDDLTELPLVVWAAHRASTVPERFDHGGITAEGATVGAPMLTSVLVRRRRPFELVVGRVQDPAVSAAVMDALRGAAAASRLRGARIARIGPVQEGYLGVDTADELLAAKLGVEVVRLDAEVVKDAYDRVEPVQVEALREESARTYEIRAAGEGLERSLRAACAVEAVVDAHGLSAVAFNCHVPAIRFGGIGVAPCFGLGRSTSRGVPWTCTGDVLTAAAMLVAKGLGAGAQYHELESYDYVTDEFVVASSGEHDLALAPEARPLLIANDWFAHDPCVGVCACFSPGAGPASLLALADIGGDYRLICAEGEFTGRAFPSTGTANAGFRFRRGLGAWTRWCELGAGHHSSASPGDLSPASRSCARFVGIEHAVA